MHQVAPVGERRFRSWSGEHPMSRLSIALRHWSALLCTWVRLIPVNAGAASRCFAYGAALYVALWATGAAAIPVLIGSDVSAVELFQIDPVTAGIVSIGPLGDPIVASLTYDLGNGILYGSSTATHNLLLIDPATGSASVIGPFGISSYMHSIEFNSNTNVLYGISAPSDFLYTIDIGSGTATAVGATGIGHVGGMAYDPVNDIMYATDGGPHGSSGLFSIDLSSGASTFIGPLDNSSVDNISGLAFDPALGLFGSDNGLISGLVNQLFGIDPASGQANLIGDMNTGNFLGLAFVPEPSTAFLLACGLAGLALRRPLSA